MIQNKKKAGLLFLILAVPAFVVLIGSFFKAEHKFSLPYIGDEAVKPVSFIALDGEDYSLIDSSKSYILTFHCQQEEAVSNKVLSEFTRVQEMYAGTPVEHSFQLYSIFTCDEPDAYIKDVSKLYDVDSGFWKLLKPKDSLSVIINALGVQLDTEAKDYAEQAYTAVYLLDRSRKVRGFYNGMSNDDVNKLIEDIRVLENEYK